MKRVLDPGEQKVHKFTVGPGDVARFSGQLVHPVCATFTLAREIEWCTRLFVLDILEEDEEGVGTRLTIEHKGPAFEGDEVEVRAEVERLSKNELICTYKALVNDRLVAEGITGQKVLKKSRIKEIFSKLER